MQSWNIGDARVTRIVELEIAGGSRFILPDATSDACRPIDWMVPHFANERGDLIMSVHALVVESQGRRIIVDTCIGNDKQGRAILTWNGMQTSFLADLEGVGFAAESIDTVLCTHLHVDHVGWNTMLVDDVWVPTFPRADYLIAREEWNYWRQEDDAHSEAILSDSVWPIFDSGFAKLVDMDHRLTSEVWLEPTPGHTPGHVSRLRDTHRDMSADSGTHTGTCQPTPGHTPGHVSVHMDSRGESAVITGDRMHHPCQMTHPEWCSPADFDSDAARATRESLLAHWQERGTLVIGTHFATPTAGRVRPLAQGTYWFDVEV